jgi:hypothetical protein
VIGNQTSESLVSITLNNLKALIRAHASLMQTLQSCSVNNVEHTYSIMNGS